MSYQPLERKVENRAQERGESLQPVNGGQTTTERFDHLSPETRARIANGLANGRPSTPNTAGQRPQTAPPPNPKQQAVTFALELAKIRATSSAAGKRETDVDQLIADAEKINSFIGQSTSVPRF